MEEGFPADRDNYRRLGFAGQSGCQVSNHPATRRSSSRIGRLAHKPEVHSFRARCWPRFLNSRPRNVGPRIVGRWFVWRRDFQKSAVCQRRIRWFHSTIDDSGQVDYAVARVHAFLSSAIDPAQRGGQRWASGSCTPIIAAAVSPGQDHCSLESKLQIGKILVTARGGMLFVSRRAKSSRRFGVWLNAARVSVLLFISNA